MVVESSRRAEATSSSNGFGNAFSAAIIYFLVFDFLEKGREYEMKTFWSFLFLKKKIKKKKI